MPRLVRTGRRFVESSTRFHQICSTGEEKSISAYHQVGAIVPTEVNYQPNTTRDYKLLFELIYGRYDSINAKNANSSLTAMARIVNLHVASGIPKERLSIVGVVHNNGLDAFLTNEKYREKYGIDNPSLPLIAEFLKLGARFIACGQTVEMNGNTSTEFIPDLKIALTAQTVLLNTWDKGMFAFKLAILNNDGQKKRYLILARDYNCNMVCSNWNGLDILGSFGCCLSGRYRKFIRLDKN
jgi:intracellular sulfur oxidation DsrE/DsrF family protein